MFIGLISLCQCQNNNGSVVIDVLTNYIAAIPALGSALAVVTPTLASMLVGVVAGASVLLVVSTVQRILPKRVAS